MELLIAGLLLFIGAHSVRIFADDWRSSMITRLGEKPWKGLISVVSLAGFVLMILGYDATRSAPIPIYEPPFWLRHVAVLLMLLSSILMVAAYVPRNALKPKMGHPMVLSVKTWAFAHLLANGTLADLLLFGSFVIWAVLDFRISRRRDRAQGVSYAEGTLANTLIAVIGGVGLWAAFAFWLHARWVGVAPLGM